MALTGIIIETPALEEIGLPILVSEYDIQREINAAGSWAVSFPASQTLAKQVKSRWRVSIVEEGREGYLMRRGVVLTRNYRVNADGTGILTLAGYTRLYTLTAGSTHFNLIYDGLISVGAIANDLAGETVAVPSGASSVFPKVTFSESSKLAALLKIGEIARYNLRETFVEDGFEFVKWDDVPDSGFRFVTVEHAGPELEHSHENGMGLIAGTPTIGYDGKDIATRIIPIGVEYDGSPLELNSSDKTSPYTIQTGSNPDATNFYYLEDSDATDAVGLIELQYHRQDVQNPSDNATTRLAAANALYKLAVGELQKRKSDVISFACEIANARHIDALPGDRVRIQFRGRAFTPAGSITWQDIDQDFLIVKRRDSGGTAGVRGVSFTLAAPDVPLEDPELPDAVPIPPPPRDVPNPPDPDPGGDPGGNDPGSESGPGDTPPFEDVGAPQVPDVPPTAPVAELPPFSPSGPNPYQDCCAPPLKIGDVGDTPPPEGGGGDVANPSGYLPSVTPEDSPWPLDVSLAGATDGDKYMIITWTHAHDGSPDVLTPSAPWLSGVTSLNFTEAEDGGPQDVFGSSDDIASAATRVEVWLGDVNVGAISGPPVLTLSLPGPTASWPTTPQVGFGAYGILLHGVNGTDPIPQIDFADGMDTNVSHSLAAPTPSSQYFVVGFQRAITAGGVETGVADGDTGAIVAPSGWTRVSVVHQDIELADHSGELQHGGVQMLIARHSADGATAITWGSAGSYTVSVAIEVKPA